MPPFSVVNFIKEVFVLELKRHIRRCSVTVTWIWFKFSPFASVKSCTIFTICENFPADNYDKNRSYWGSFFLFANFHSLPLTQPELILWTFSLIENLLRKIIWKIEKNYLGKKGITKSASEVCRLWLWQRWLKECFESIPNFLPIKYFFKFNFKIPCFQLPQNVLRTDEMTRS